MLSRKGFVLTLDFILGMTIVFVVLIVSLFFVTQGSEVTISEHQLLRIGSDVVTVMDDQKTFDTFDKIAMESTMYTLLPANYDMLVRIQGNISGQSNATIEIGGEVQPRRFLVAGRRLALTDDNTYLKLTYFVWTR